MRRALLAAAVGAAVLAGCGEGSGTSSTQATGAAQAPAPAGSGVKLARIGDFDQPDYVAQPPGSDDLYVVERPGRIELLRGGHGAPETALDISDQVAEEGEQGLLSVAFAPDFQGSRLLYVYFTGNDQGQHVFEYRANEDGTVDESSARQLLHMDDFASNHNGGLLLFGPDGQLYIGTGDGGLAGDPRRNGQDLGSLLGKILRIDPRPSGGRPYSVPASNPFVGRPGARPEICDYGLRNPWRFSFDRGTAALSIGDVGQNSQEEVDYRPAEQVCGNNFGWSAYEGDERFNQDQSAPGAVPPILTYSHAEGCSITGGYVVRDPSLPSLAGRYVYGDYCAGELRSLRPSIPRAKDDRALGIQVPSLDSFGQDNKGRIYVVSLDGPVYRLAAR